MIFQYTWPSVVQERKSQTRRVVKSGEMAIRGRYNRIHAVTYNGRVKWEIGKTYSVQPGRGSAQIARIRLVRIRNECLSRISTQAALAEGFGSRQAFLHAWQAIHGLDSLNVRVWVLEFELETPTFDAALLMLHKEPAFLV